MPRESGGLSRSTCEGHEATALQLPGRVLRGQGPRGMQAALAQRPCSPGGRREPGRPLPGDSSSDSLSTRLHCHLGPTRQPFFESPVQQEGAERVENFAQGEASGRENAEEGLKNPSEPPHQRHRQSPWSVFEERFHSFTIHTPPGSTKAEAEKQKLVIGIREHSRAPAPTQLQGWISPWKEVTPFRGAATLGQRNSLFQSPSIKCCWQLVRFSFERNQNSSEHCPWGLGPARGESVRVEISILLKMVRNAHGRQGEARLQQGCGGSHVG